MVSRAGYTKAASLDFFLNQFFSLILLICVVQCASVAEPLFSSLFRVDFLHQPKVVDPYHIAFHRIGIGADDLQA